MKKQLWLQAKQLLHKPKVPQKSRSDAAFLWAVFF